MTEEEWRTCQLPSRMLDFLQRQPPLQPIHRESRRRRLFVCACARVGLPDLDDPRAERALQIAEQFADDLATPQELKNASKDARAVRNAIDIGNKGHAWVAADTVAIACKRPSRHPFSWTGVRGATAAHYWSDRGSTADLIRHIFPHPTEAAPAWAGTASAEVRSLARAVYDRTGAAFALHDALLEAGETEMAEHFRTTEHPKGCWALDLIRGAP